MVPTDFSECSDRALELAGKLAKQNNANLVILHVSELNSGLDPSTVVHPNNRPDAISVGDYLVATAKEHIQLQAKKVLGGFRYSCKVSFGPVPATIIAEAAEENVDLLVLGTHGRTGLEHFFIGSVAERVVRTASVPVLVVRQQSKNEDDGKTLEEHFIEDEMQG